MKMIEIEKAVEWLIANSGNYFNARGKFSPEMIYDFQTAMGGQPEIQNNNLEYLDEEVEIKRYIEYMYDGRYERGTEEYIMLDKCARHFWKVGAEWGKKQGLSLTPEDIKMICYIDSACANDELEEAFRTGHAMSNDEYYEEVLRRFNEQKKL